MIIQKANRGYPLIVMSSTNKNYKPNTMNKNFQIKLLTENSIVKEKKRIKIDKNNKIVKKKLTRIINAFDFKKFKISTN